jgi:hypothetical protein
VDGADDDEVDPATSCNDGIDSDCDGWVDLLDPDCASPVTDTEQSIADCATDTSGFSGLYQCNDVVDNDTDGRADVNDPGCRSGYDNLEAY